MENQINLLIEILRAQTELHARLLVAAERKRTAIIAGDLVAMEQTLAEEYEWLEKVTAAERSRAQVVTDLAISLEITAVDVTVSVLLEKLPPALGEPLNAARKGLKEVIDKLRFRTRQNAELLKASMEHVDNFLMMISTAGNVQTYNRKGCLARSPVRLLDRSA